MDDPIAFLNARLDELEASKDEIHHQDCDSRECRCYEAYPCNCGEPQRILADIAAKRQIISKAEQARERQGMSAEDEDYWWDMHEVIALLALPFASHPDYREEWRP